MPFSVDSIDLIILLNKSLSISIKVKNLLKIVISILILSIKSLKLPSFLIELTRLWIWILESLMSLIILLYSHSNLKWDFYKK